MRCDEKFDEADSAVVKIASQKYYLASPDVGSLSMTVLGTCSPGRRCTLMNGMN
jgi:hypothetical protein